MDNQIEIKPIGHIRSREGEFYLELEEAYRPALTNFSGFSHLQVLWWGHLFAGPEHRANLIENTPYVKGPEAIGVFATRSPMRPNPIRNDTQAGAGERRTCRIVGSGSN